MLDDSNVQYIELFQGFSIFRMKATGKEACYMEPLSETLRHMDIPSPDVMFHQLEKAPRVNNNIPLFE